MKNMAFRTRYFLFLSISISVLYNNAVSAAKLPILSRSETCPNRLDEPLADSSRIRSTSTASRVVNGDQVLYTDFVYYFAQVISTTGVTCSGVIIDKKHVAMAAKCGDAARVVMANNFGIDTIQAESTNYDDRYTSLLNSSNFEYNNYNIAIVTLREELSTNRFVRVSMNASIPSKNTYVRVVGSGYLADGKPSSMIESDLKLYQVDLPTYDDASCEAYVNDTWRPGFQGFDNLTINFDYQGCIGYHNRTCGLCTADEGAPVIQYQNNDEGQPRPVLVGVVSLVHPSCAVSSYPSIYVKTHHMEDFFKKFNAKFRESTIEVPNLNPTPTPTSSPPPIPTATSTMTATPSPSIGSDPEEEEPKSGLSAGAIVGIVIGCLVAVGIVVIIYVWLRERRLSPPRRNIVE